MNDAASPDKRDIRKIVVTGAESTGKTTLVDRLAVHFSCPLVEEQLRKFVDDHGRQPVFEDYREVTEMMCDAEQSAVELAASNGAKLILADTDCLSLEVYWRYYFDHVPEMHREAEPTDLYILLSDDVPWVEDPGQRDGLQVRTETQPLFADRLRERNLPHVEVSGAWEERFNAAVAAIKKELSHDTGRS